MPVAFPADVGSNDVIGNQSLLNAKCQPLTFGSKIVLSLKKQAAILVFRIFNNEVGGPSRGNESNRPCETVEGGLATGATLVQMRDSDDCDAEPVGHVRQRLQNLPGFDIAIASLPGRRRRVATFSNILFYSIIGGSVAIVLTRLTIELGGDVIAFVERLGG